MANLSDIFKKKKQEIDAVQSQIESGVGKVKDNVVKFNGGVDTFQAPKERSTSPFSINLTDRSQPFVSLNHDWFGDNNKKEERTPLVSFNFSDPTKPLISVDKDRLKIEPYESPKGSLSERSRRRDGDYFSRPQFQNPEQILYNNTYYRILDDPTHTKMYTGLEKYFTGRGGAVDHTKAEDFRAQYKSDRAKLDAEYERVKEEYGKDSIKTRALKQFIDDYEELGKELESSFAISTSDYYAQAADSQIKAIYGDVFERPDFREKVSSVRDDDDMFWLLAGPELTNFVSGGGAPQSAQDLVYYLYATEGKDAALKFVRSELGKAATAANAYNEYGLATTSTGDPVLDALSASVSMLTTLTRGHLFNAITEPPKFIKGLIGADKDDPDDKQLAIGYTISDSTDSYLKSMVDAGLKEAGVSDEQFKQIADAGFSQLGQMVGSEAWYKEAKDASDYQKQFLGYIFLSTNFDPEATKVVWESIKEHEKNLWDLTKAGSNVSSIGEETRMTEQLENEYLGLAGTKLPGFFKDVGEGATLEQFLHHGAGSAIEQILPWMLGSFVGEFAGGLGASSKAASAWANRASSFSMGTMIGGRAYAEALDRGASRETALLYGIWNGAEEFITDRFLDGAGAGLSKVTGSAVEKAMAKISDPVLKALASAGIRAGGEAAQEYIQEAGEPIKNYIFFHEGDWKDAFLGEGDTVPEQVLDALLDPDRLYAASLGGLTSLMMSPGNTLSDISGNFSYRDLGSSMSKVGAIDTAVDLILSNPADVDPEAYEEAKKTAELIKGGTKVSDQAKGEMIANFVRAGGDISILTNPDTMVYNKDALTLEDYIAGAKSMLVSLEGDVELAEDVAKLAMGEEISDDAMAAIQKDTSAVLVLSQLLGDLDMSEDTALSRAAEAFTVRTGDKTYATLVAKNPDKTVVNPVTQQLITTGVKLEDAKGVGEIVGKAMDGKKITKAEAKKINIKDAAVRTVVNETLGTKLSETSTPAQVLSVLNDYAASMVETKEMQAAVKSGAKAAADARMTAAGRAFRPAGETVTIGGVQYSHDAFISDYMAKNNASRERAEQAWNGLRRVNAALYGEEENDGRRTVPGDEEGRHVSLAAGGAVSEGTERRAGSGRTAVTGTESTTGGVEETGDGAVSETPRGEKITKLNSEQREFAESARDDGFASVTLIKGPLLNAAGNEVNAKVDGTGNLTIRWDNPHVNAKRVERHERLHLWLSVFGPSGEARANFVMNALTDILESYDPSDDGGFSEVFKPFGEVESREITLESLFETYAEVYGEAYAGLSEQEFNDRIYEEILADMYAGLDLYGAGTDIFEDQAEMYILESGLREDFFRGEGKDEGGDDRFSASVEPGRYDLSNPFRDSTDWNLPTDVRPFPGEEPMHTQLERFSVSSMADGANFDLQLNSEGYPYALIDRRTGERVTHVTEKMMIGTPLGNIIQMAVKSKDNPNGITEKEAKAQRQMLADAMNLIVKYNDAAVVWELVGSQLFSAVKANSDKQYNKTIDFSTICKKTMAIVDAMSETMKRLGRGLTRREVEVVYEETGRAGQATPCPVCYVFSRWMGIGNLLDQIRVFQEQYADMSEEELIDFMRTIDGKRTADGEQGEIYDFLDSLSESKREEYIDKNGLPKIGKILSELKSKPNNAAAKAIEKLQQHQQSLEAISNLTNALPNATPEQAPRWQALINSLQKNILDETQIQELNDQMEEADRQVERYEAYQWLAKTVLMADASKVNEDGEAVGGWKKNKKYNKVPNDILFDLNRGGDFAKEYPLTWAFRTGKGCAMGKAILPYSDARVGETIQGVALSDVKKIRIGGMEELQKIMNDQSLTGRQKATARGRLNEFRIGDAKKASKTLATGRKKMKQQNLIGGMRYQSTSDFRYEFGSDYLMSFLEMQALGANVQLYTKVIEAVDFLASTGADCNLSVMPLGDGYVEVVDPETGEVVIDPKTGKPKLKLAFSNVTGINADAAIKKSRQYDNVQLILVGINDTNIRLALEGDDVTFVIPFHGSGQSVHQIQTLMDMIGEHLDVTQAQDYTDVQSDHPLPMEDDTHNGPGYRTKEQKAMWDLRMAIIMGKCAGGLNAKQQALLNKNKHLQKLYDMFYVDASAPAYHNYLAEDQAKQIFPYEYWDKTTTYATADRNGEIFQDYCRSMGIAPRFSGTNSKGETVDHGDFTKDKGYWKLLIDRSMYKNVYDENGDWIGYGEYRDQQAINMSNIKLSDLDPETGKAQFTNGEMSKQYDATHNEQDRESRDSIVTRSIQRIEALRDKTDVFREGNIYDRTRVSKGAREDLMKAQSEMRERYSAAPAWKQKRTFNKDKNSNGVFNTTELIDLAEKSSKSWTGGQLYDTMSMNDAEMRQFHENIERLSGNMPEYGTEEVEPFEAFFTVERGNKKYKYLVELDGYMHGRVLQKRELTAVYQSKVAAAKERGYANKEGRRTGGSASAGSDRRGTRRDVRSAAGERSQYSVDDRLAAGESRRDASAVPEAAGQGVQGESNLVTRYSLALSDPGFKSSNKEAPVTDERDQVLYVAPSSDAWAVARDADGSLLNTSYIQNELGLPIYDNPHDAYAPEERGSAESGVGHLTANPSTIPTYRQAFQYLKNTHDNFRDLRVLDASSGQGFGTAYGRSPAAAGKEAQAEYEALVDKRKRNTLFGKKTPEADIKREAALKKLVDEIKNLTGDFDTSDVSFNVTDLEPYHGPGHSVDYEKYGGLIAAIESGEEEPFDFIINNAVINVMAQDAREELLANLIRMLKPGGQLFINPAFAKEWDGYKKAIPLEEYKQRVANGEDVSKKNVIIAPSTKNTGGEIYTAQSKSIQKGYTDPEFMAFAKDVAKQALGEDIQIEKGSKLPGLNKGFVITRSESAQPSERYSVAGPEAQQKNREFNKRQTKVGSGLRTLNSDKAMTRSTVKLNGVPANVGKQMGDQIYVHKNYADRVVPADVLENAETILNTEYPGFQYNTIMYNRKTGEVRFDEAPNFDTAREPIPGRTVTVKPDGSTNPNYYDQIWHHKWMWVDNDYTGFDVADSWNWSKQWLSTLPEKANGSTRGPEGWNKQMDRFGLPKDPASEIEIKDKKAEIAAIKALRSDGRFSVAPTDKKNPFKPGSFEATVYDLVQKSGDGKALQDSINALIEKRNASLDRDKAPVIPSKELGKPINKKQKEIQLDQLQKLLDTYGALKKGEKAARDVSFPERTKEDRYTRRFTRTAAEAKGIPERMVPEMVDSLLTEDLLTYARITDTGAIKRGDAKFDDLGYKKAIKEWNDNIASSYSNPTKYDIAFGERLLVEAARNGDDAVAMKVLADLSAMGTQAGQVVQSMRLLKKLGPTGQLYYIQKAVDRLNKQNESKIAKGKWNPIVINQDLAKAVLLSETTEEMQTAMDELIADIAEQVPVTLKDKWDAWRYLAMLGNPRTHIRNYVGNMVFSPIRFTSDLLSAAGQKMFIKDPLERTKDAGARLGSKKYADVREFVAADFEEMKPQITGTGKMNPLNEIMDKRKIFKSKAFGWLNKLSDWNSDMLEKEDVIFLRKAYINAMTQFIAAKGLSLEELNDSTEGGKILNDARQFAALEAQKATYRDFNRLASALNQAKRAPGVGFLLDGLLPFTKTPLNILRRGIEYSPVGLAKGISYDLYQVQKGNLTAAEAIDHIAAGMTGTGVAILGMFLASLGLARGGDDDDDKKAQLEAAEGHQNYSIEIPGVGSYTIDWAAPVALPFFVGVEAYNRISDGGPMTIWDWANALTLIAEPLTSLSMLDGVNSTLAAVRYGDPDEALSTVATNLLTSYLSQGAPTIFGQIARTIDPDRRSTYTDKNMDTPAWLQRFAQGLQGKIPGAASEKMAYVDVWGRKDTNESLLLRALENFISPGYASRINETPIDQELTRLAESLGDSSVLPSSISKYFQVEGETLNLNAKQYEQLKTVTGQTAFSLLGNVMDDAIYLAMDDEQKAMVIKEIMSISAAIGKQAVAPTYKPDSWIQRAIDQDNLETAAMYHALGKMDTGLSGYQLISAMDWLTDDERGKLIMSEHSNTPRNMTDYTKKKYKFVLTDEQIAREREIYNGLFWQSYAALISDPKYIRAGVAERAKMISDMQSDLGEAARRQLGDELRAAGYTSVLLDDSDVPEQVTNLYDLLNRG